MKAEKIAGRIAEIERKDFPSSVTDLTKAERALASALAAGTNTAAAHTALQAARDFVDGFESALTALDAQWYEAASEEYSAAMKAIEDERLSKYREGEGEIRSALKSISGTFKKLLPEDYAALSADIQEKALAACWASLSIVWNNKYRAIGAKPVPRPRRLTLAEKRTAEQIAASKALV